MEYISKIIGLLKNYKQSNSRQLSSFDYAQEDANIPFINGFFVGFFETEIAGKLSSCIDAYQFNAHLRTALDYTQDMTFSDIQSAFQEIEVCFTLFQDAANRCINQYPNVKERINLKVEQTLQLFKSPEEITKQLIKSFETYGPTILYNLELEDNQYNAGLFFGQQIESLLEGVSYTRSLSSVEVTDLTLIFSGFLNGFFDGNNIEIEHCVDLQQLQIHLQKAYELYRKYDKENLIEGIEEIFEALWLIDLQKCSQVDSNKIIIQKIENIIKLVTNKLVLTEKVSENLIFKWGTIVNQMQMSIEASGQGEWYMFGKHIGICVDILLT